MDSVPQPPSPRDDEDLDDDDSASVDSINVTAVLSAEVDEDDRLAYLCTNTDGTEEVYDRSDLMDGGRHQKLVLAFERRNPPAWDPLCPYCDGDGCEECECPDCDRPCRFFHGVNYGCTLHPVI